LRISSDVEVALAGNKRLLSSNDIDELNQVNKS